MFVEALPPGTSTRIQELQQSEMRKHAAMISHARNRRLSQEQLSGDDKSVVPCGLIETPLQLRYASSPQPNKRPWAIPRSSHSRSHVPRRTSTHYSQTSHKQLSQAVDSEDEDATKIAERLKAIWERDFSYLISSSRHMPPFYRNPHNNTSSFFRATEYCKFFLAVSIRQS